MTSSNESLFAVSPSKPTPEAKAVRIVADNSLFDIDRELDLILDTMDQEIDEQGKASDEHGTFYQVL